MRISLCNISSRKTAPLSRRRNLQVVSSLEGAEARVPFNFKRVKSTVPEPQLVSTCNDVAAVILGGGESDSRRLFPLTENRTLPAVPFGGIYRLIDIAMSNCIHSNIFKIYILTQYNSTSLNRYLTRTYNLGGGVPFGGDGFMEVVAATQSPDSQRWADGAADSVRQWYGLLDPSQERAIHDVLVLPSDQVYRTDFSRLVAFHREELADITIVCHEVDRSKAPQFGMVRFDSTRQIKEFTEKPKGDDIVSMSMDWDELGSFLEFGSTQLQPQKVTHDDDRAFIASCGMYIFKREVLQKLLSKKSRDFGSQMIPEALKEGYKVMAYHLDSYWEDIGGSIADFYKLNIRLVSDDPPFDFNASRNLFFASPSNLPPSNINECITKNAMIGPGCSISKSEISHSIIGSRSIIGEGCKIIDSIVMGADYYEQDKKFPRTVGRTFPHIGIGSGTTITKAIIDKNARIGKNCQLINTEGIWESFDRIKTGICIRDGIIICSKSAVVPDNTII